MTLRLPTIQRRTPQRLATPDISLPLKEAKARSAMFGAIGEAVGTATKLAADYTERESRREVQEAELFVHSQDNAFVASRAGREEFSVLETDDEDFIGLADELGFSDPSSVIPAHRIYPEWRRKNYDRAINEAASRISNRRVRDDFINRYTLEKDKRYTQDSVDATKVQIKYAATKTMEAAESFMLNRDFGGARLAVESSTMGSEAKQRALTLIDKREQVDYFNETIERSDIDTMETALNQLIKNDPKVTSRLEAEEQKVLASQLRTAIGKAKTAVLSAAESSLQIQKADAQSQIKDIWNNKPVNMMEYEANKRALSRKYPVLAREMEWTQKHQPTVSGILMAPPSIQMETLKGLTERSQGDRETSYLINQLGEAITRGQTARREDSLKWADSVGFVVTEPLDYSSTETLQESLAARVKPVLSIQRQYGTFTGFLTKDELNEFGSRLENSPNKLEYFASINTALGEYAEPFYEQLKQYNIGETAALAGQIMTWGEAYRPVAENILKGSNLRKTDNLTQLKMKEVNSELEAFAVSRFGGIFTGNKKQQSLNIEAFKDVYAVTGGKEEAFEQLTGGTIDYNGYTIQSPVPGMSGWAYKSYMKNIRPEYWATPEMRVYGYTPEQFRESFLNGSLKQAGLGRGVSFLVEPDGSRVKAPDGVTDFKFVFSPDAPTSAALLEEWKAQQDAEREAAARSAKQQEATATATSIEYLLRGLGD